MAPQKAEIEDVVTSIRRLIRETRPPKRAASAPPQTAPAGGTAQPRPPALLLSPAQLVALPTRPVRPDEAARAAQARAGSAAPADRDRTASAGDDMLAESLADAVREQIARTLPSQIGALAPRLLDEDVLRPIVADLIRKELEGPLGERITRGVRKLVRQEINRAITLRRLE